MIVPQHPENEPKSTQLFHLTKDPGELTDLSKENPEQLEKMNAQLDSWWKP
jgi:1,2-phenylacetyl-CoA epoxidase catalytic subunit